jgi:ribosomal protein S14
MIYYYSMQLPASIVKHILLDYLDIKAGLKVSDIYDLQNCEKQWRKKAKYYGLIDKKTKLKQGRTYKQLCMDCNLCDACCIKPGSYYKFLNLYLCRKCLIAHPNVVSRSKAKKYYGLDDNDLQKAAHEISFVTNYYYDKTTLYNRTDIEKIYEAKQLLFS